MSVFLYREALPRFLADVDAGSIADRLTVAFDLSEGQAPGASERESWRRSLPALAEVLRDPALAGSEIFVELFMPLNNRRCDVLLTGRDTAGRANAVLVELKQWTHVTRGPYSEFVRVGERVQQHPSFQVRDYLEHLKHFHSAFTAPGGEPITLTAAVFLHGMQPGPALALLRDDVAFGHVPQDFPIFTARDLGAFADWLAERLVPGPGGPTAQRIADGRPLPSPKLLDLLVGTVQEGKEWRLLDEQKQAYWAIRDAVQKARAGGQKKVVVVRGGPGTGKSVLAIQLLADAARQHWKVVHATGTKAFQTVLQGKTIRFSDRMLKDIFSAKLKKSLPIADLFTTFASVAKVGDTQEDTFDLVVCDEAHRLWEHRKQQYPNGTFHWVTDVPMVDEVIRSTRVSAFFLDDNQSVRHGEIGQSQVILEAAVRLGIPCELIDLELQYRCSGSSSYIRWVDGLLGFREDLDLAWKRYDAYDLQLIHRMPALDRLVRQRAAEGYSCRFVAGYCWPWSKPDGLGKLVPDVSDPSFEGWSAPWIEKTGKDLKPLDHQYFKWATQPEYIEQVGSIYSAQGFEFDWVGLIWGEDLVWRGDRWIAQPKKNRDRAFKRDLQKGGEDPLQKLKNIYRVLLTRGMRGSFVFIVDPETRAHVSDALLDLDSPMFSMAAGGPPYRYGSGDKG